MPRRFGKYLYCIGAVCIIYAVTFPRISFQPNVETQSKTDVETQPKTDVETQPKTDVETQPKTDGKTQPMKNAETQHTGPTTSVSNEEGTEGEWFEGKKIRTYDPDLNVKGLFSKSGEDRFKKFFSEQKMKVPTCDQWAVVTTVSEPNKSIIGIANLKDWCIVIVGDLSTPDDAYKELEKKDNVLYLSAKVQKEMLKDKENALLQQIPWESFGRKTIGYAIAVSQGAKVIYDFDDNNVLEPFEDGTTITPPFRYKADVGFENSVLLQFVTNDHLDSVVQGKAFNPYPFMGPEHMHSWPRGFPHDHLAKNFETWPHIEDKYYEILDYGTLKYSSVGAIQSLCNKHPDNDAVFQLSRPESTQFVFDRSPSTLPMLIPPSTYSPFNAQATTHLYNAFWGLYLPFTVTGRVSDIWRSFIVQRIFKFLGLNVLYTPPIVTNQRTAHDYSRDMNAEQHLYFRTSKLITFLDEWTPTTAETLPEIIFELWVGLYEHDYLRLKDLHCIKEYLHTLNAAGYQFPTVQLSHKQTLPQPQPSVKGQPYRSFPYTNINKDGKTFAQFQGSYEEWKSTVDWESRPDIANVKLIMMTMNEWPLQKSWMMYHGYVYGFENLYVLDSSSNPNSTAFLRYTRDTLGANVIFADMNLNEIEDIMKQVATEISGSSDIILKMDTDEFLMVFNNNTKSLTTAVPEYLQGYAKNKNHPLRIDEHSRIRYVQSSIPNKTLCQDDINTLPIYFPVSGAGVVREFYKAVFLSSKIDAKSNVNLGGHAIGVKAGISTEFGTVHYHSRCPEIENENNKRVLIRHNFIAPTDTDDEAKSKLLDMLNCTGDSLCGEGKCNSNSFVSVHKAVGYATWLHCPEKYKELYFSSKEQGQQHQELLQTIQIAEKVYAAH